MKTVPDDLNNLGSNICKIDDLKKLSDVVDKDVEKIMCIIN